MPIEDIIRLLNMVLVLVWFYYMWYLYAWWASRPREERLILSCMPLLLLLVMISSGEAIVQNVGFGSRVLLYTPVLILCIFASVRMARKVRHITKDRKEET